MNNWLCIKDNKVVNIVYSEESFMQTNDWIISHYDSYLNRDTMDIPHPIIGSTLNDDGTWEIVPVKDFSGQDFSGQDLSNRDFSFADLTGCNFTGSIIDGCNFNWTEPTYSLIGAIWNGKTIEHGPVQISNPYYYCLITDVVAVIGCAMTDVEPLIYSSDEEKNTWDTENPNRPALFWAYVKDSYTTQVNSWKV